MSEELRDYVTLKATKGPGIRGCDEYTVPWIDVNDVLDQWLDNIEEGEERSVTFTLRRLTQEQFDAICDGEDEE